MKTEQFLSHNLLFRFSEFKQFMESREQGVTDENCSMTLYNYCKKGKLTHIRKGLYRVNNPNIYQTSTISPLLVAAKAAENAVLAYHSALESHGVAYTDFNEHTYLTSHRTTDFLFQDQSYRAIYRPLIKQELKQGTSTIETVTTLGISLQRTSLERTLVDVLDRPELSGGWEEVIRSLDRITVFDAMLAVSYALSLSHASIVAKLGYFFEYQRPDYLQIDAAVLEKLLPHIPKRPYYIDRKSSIGQGTYIKKWQIIVPDYLHKRQWEEPEHAIDQ